MKKPEMYLDADARRAISTFSRLPDIQSGLDRLREDIESGAWKEKYGRLLEGDSLDLGYRLVVADKHV